jgi:uncharacterized protein
VSAYWRREGERLILEVHVQPGASRTEIAGVHGERLKIRVAAAPAEGRANEALLRFIAEKCGVPRRCVTLEGGAGSRIKRIAVAGVTAPPALF